MTVVQTMPFEVRELDLNAFRLELKSIEAENVNPGQGGMSFDDTHEHNTSVVLGNAVYARLIRIINGYTVTFEDGSYAVELVGANSNVADVTNLNTVQVRSNNSAGLIDSAALLSGILSIKKFLMNKKSLDETTGILTIYEDDNTTVYATIQTYTDDSFTTPYTKAAGEAPHSEIPL